MLEENEDMRGHHHVTLLHSVLVNHSIAIRIRINWNPDPREATHALHFASGRVFGRIVMSYKHA